LCVAQFFAAWIKSLIGTTEDEKAAGTAGALAALQQTLEGAFGECSKGKPFFAGDEPGYVDVALGGYLGWMRAYEAVAGVNLLNAGRTPLLVAWAERFARLDAAKGVFPEVDQILQYGKALQARTAASATPNN
jgi:glutathione S-transferase